MERVGQGGLLLLVFLKGEKMSKEKAIELLRKVDRHILHHTEGYCLTQDLKTLKEYIQQALAELEKQEPKCKTCGGTGQVGEEESYHGRSAGYKECPDCQKAEPTEFTKTIRHKLLDVALYCGGMTETAEPFRDLREACDIIDQQAEEIERKNKWLISMLEQCDWEDGNEGEQMYFVPKEWIVPALKGRRIKWEKM